MLPLEASVLDRSSWSGEGEEGQTSYVPRDEDAGRVSEFEALYRSEVRAVTAFFARRSRDPQTVFDLTADTFMQAMRSFGTFDPARGSGLPWLLAIARRVYAKHCERMTQARDVARREHASQVLDEDETEEIADRIDAEQAGRKLLEELAGMCSIDREAVELVDIVGLTPKQAARALGVSPGALRVRLYRARARLRKGHNSRG